MRDGHSEALGIPVVEAVGEGERRSRGGGGNEPAAQGKSTGRGGGVPHGIAGLWCQIRLGLIGLHQAGGEPKDEDAADEETENDGGDS